MALFNETTEHPDKQPPKPTVKPTNTFIEPEHYHGITIDTEYVPQSSLLQWIEGSDWKVNYYSQVLDSSNEPQVLSTAREPIYQQYREIRNLELKITTPLSFQPDEVTQVMTVTGSGISYPFIKANKYDMFTADVGDGRVGLFTITSATRATILKDSTFNIEFIKVADFTEAHANDLKRKTIQSFHFSRESLMEGCGPFLTEDQYQRQDDYRKLLDELIGRYVNDFFSRQFSTLLVPDQPETTYDHYVTRVLKQLIPAKDYPELRHVRELNTSGETVMKLPTLWDALLKHSPTLLHSSIRRIQGVSTNVFVGRPTLSTLRATGIKRVIFPKESPTDVDAYHTGKAYRELVGYVLNEGRPSRHVQFGGATQAERDLTWFKPTDIGSEIPADHLPPIHPVVHDDHYVLSEAFYSHRTSDQSCLEFLALQIMNAEPISHAHLGRVLQDVRDWDNLERYYYYPIVWMALRMGMRR